MIRPCGHLRFYMEIFLLGMLSAFKTKNILVILDKKQDTTRGSS